MTDSWPTHLIELESFPGWQVKVYDLSVQELDAIEAALAENKFTQIGGALLPCIQSWNLKDRSGNLLEVSEESLQQVPSVVLKQIMSQVLDRLNAPAIPKSTTTTE